MKAFANFSLTALFKTDNYLKNLHEVEIDSIEQFVYKYNLDYTILLGINCLMVSRFDELVSGKPQLYGTEEPELAGEWVEIDFIADMKPLDILNEILELVQVDEDFYEALKGAPSFTKVTQTWQGEGEGEEVWLIESLNDPRALEVKLDEEGDQTMQFLPKQAPKNGYTH